MFYRHWAANVGIGFRTPEEFFLGETPKPMTHRFDPLKYIKSETQTLGKFLIMELAITSSNGIVNRLS